MELYTQALAVSPAGRQAHLLYANRAAAHTQMKDYRRALEDAERSVVLQPTYAKGHSRVAASLHSLGRSVLGGRIVNVDVDVWWTCVSSIRVRGTGGRGPFARYRQLVRVVRGFGFGCGGRFEDAVKAYETALRLDPALTTAAEGLASARAKVNDRRAATAAAAAPRPAVPRTYACVTVVLLSSSWPGPVAVMQRCLFEAVPLCWPCYRLSV